MKASAIRSRGFTRIHSCETLEAMKTLLALVLFPLASALLRAKDDSALLERLRNRDPDAMGELYDRYSRLTYSLIYRVVRNQSVAEDLVQETFIRVWNRIQGFDQQRGALGPWILTVARNRSIDYLRSVDGRMAASSLEVEKMEHPAMFSNLEGEIMNMDRVRSLKAAFESLQQLYRMNGRSADSSLWHWSDLHYALLEHPLANAVDKTTKAKLNVGPMAKAGGANTLNVSSYNAATFQQTGGASFRIVVDVGNWDQSRAINTPGQSGNVDSPHYRDLAEKWSKGEYFPLLYSRKMIDDAAEQRFELQPAK